MDGEAKTFILLLWYMMKNYIAEVVNAVALSPAHEQRGNDASSGVVL